MALILRAAFLAKRLMKDFVGVGLPHNQIRVANILYSFAVIF
jgi:hypothetical protein